MGRELAAAIYQARQQVVDSTLSRVCQDAPEGLLDAIERPGGSDGGGSG